MATAVGTAFLVRWQQRQRAARVKTYATAYAVRASSASPRRT